MIFCVGVMCLGEYDVCDVTLSVYLHRASLKNAIWIYNAVWIFTQSNITSRLSYSPEWRVHNTNTENHDH